MAGSMLGASIIQQSETSAGPSTGSLVPPSTAHSAPPPEAEASTTAKNQKHRRGPDAPPTATKESTAVGGVRERENRAAVKKRWEAGAMEENEEDHNRKRKGRDWREQEQQRQKRQPPPHHKSSYPPPEDAYAYAYAREVGRYAEQRLAPLPPVRAHFAHVAARHVPREFQPPNDDNDDNEEEEEGGGGGDVPLAEGSEREYRHRREEVRRREETEVRRREETEARRREETRRRDPRYEDVRRVAARDSREEAAYVQREREETSRPQAYHGGSSGPAHNVREEGRGTRHEEAASSSVRRSGAVKFDPRQLSLIFLGRRGHSPDMVTSDVVISADGIRFIATVLAEARKKDRADALATASSSNAAEPEWRRTALMQELDDARKDVALLETKIKAERNRHQQQIKHLKELAAESEKNARRESERALRAYMKSAVHALHRLQKDDDE